MALFRALGYFFGEAFTSLWRSRLVNAISIGTIAVSLFVLGAFLTVAGNLGDVVTKWTEKIQIIVYLEADIEDRVQASLENRLIEDPAVDAHPVDGLPEVHRAGADRLAHPHRGQVGTIAPERRTNIR